MNVRRATALDVADLIRVRLAVKENVLDRERLTALGITEDSLERMLASTHAGWCAEARGKIVGFSMIDKQDASVFALFVLPEYEGRGTGSALLTAAVSYLAATGHVRATLSTEHGTRALGFYQANGWRKIGTNARGEAVLELVLD